MEIDRKIINCVFDCSMESTLGYCLFYIVFLFRLFRKLDSNSHCPCCTSAGKNYGAIHHNSVSHFTIPVSSSDIPSGITQIGHMKIVTLLITELGGLVLFFCWKWSYFFVS